MALWSSSINAVCPEVIYAFPDKVITLSFWATAGKTSNKAIAENQQLAQQAYGLANQLGLVQNFADANVQYLYQDGVFYTQAANGEYVVIVPPAGALVESLPEDFETVVLNGNEYYKVDNTVYSVAIVDGKAYFEVIGQDYR